ncbi:hypothetical protein [Limnofasciculus baicalensis]|uniref:Cxxc_20_cxxc protein n=1 Tax=Limnofasciculus baicalensis BBK-W-15 TaxID=2699891 RepID=A0AAE3GML2_9CYAN|nr:hypothetical protein [Limnofasciculus baicalensis]MCP2727385.1 hypothetical protein [Limnofasciculus baicalensis BBK-W-15]
MSVPNDHQTSHPKNLAYKGQLICPYCQYSFPLTWHRYWAAPLGSYRCPQCKKLSHLKANSVWVFPILVIGIIFIFGIPSLALAYISNNFLAGAAFFVISSLGIVIPIDKWLDGHLRRLQIRSQ